MSLLTTNVNFANLLHKNTANYALKIPHLLPSPWVGNPFLAHGWEIPFSPVGGKSLSRPWVGNPFPARGWEIPFSPVGGKSLSRPWVGNSFLARGWEIPFSPVGGKSLSRPWVGNPFPARGWEIPFPPFGARPNAWIEVRLLGFTLYLHKTVLWKSRISRDIEQVLVLKFRF